MIRDEDPIPPYVCCVVTEGVWTIFGATLLIVALFTIATMKYFKKYLAKSKFTHRNLKMMSKLVNEDGKNVAAIIREDNIPVKDFVSYCQARRRKQRINEYEFVKAINLSQRRTENLTTIIAHQPDNCVLNHNSGSVPYDHNRVTLNREGGDYINATVLDGVYRLGRTWIATQGPMNNTIGDFWSLVWEQKTNVIVMLTKTFECIQVMCSQYWPLSFNKVERHPDGIAVELIAEEKFAHYKISTLKVSKDGVERIVKHFHYLEWPVYELADSSSFLLFLNHLHEELEYQEKEKENHAPPIVHCHDGGGRTGTFLAIEANLFMVNNEDEVAIFETMQWLRTQRKSFVTNSGQYKFIYNVIEDHVACGDTQIETGKMNLQVSMLTHYTGEVGRSGHRRGTTINGFQKEFRQLCSLRPRYTIGDCAAGHRSENRNKNRNATVVPWDERRPYLTSFQNSRDGGDYINAVYIDGYANTKEAICTEWPMVHTMANFWAMIYDHDVTAIVVLEHHDDMFDFKRFWPVDPNPLTFGSLFSVAMKKHSVVSGCCDAWDFDVRKVGLSSKSVPDIANCLDFSGMDPKPVTLFQISKDAITHGKPLPSKSAFLQMILHVNEWKKNNDYSSRKWQKRADEIHHKVTVVSRDGIAMAGIYCAVVNCVDQIESRGLVDVFQAVRGVKKYRPQLVPDAEEFKFCYDLVLEYIKKYVSSCGKVI